MRDVFSLITDGRTRFPQIALLKDGVPIPPADYTTSKLVSGLNLPNFLRLDRVKAAMSQGATIQMGQMEQFWKPVADACSRLSAETGLKSSAVGFVSPPGKGAFNLHQDAVHVVVVQTEGAKHWEVYDSFGDSIAPGLVRAPEGAEPAHDMTLKKGDVFYMPPGRPHRAKAVDGWSVHVSITAEPVMAKQVLQDRVGELISALPDFELPALWNRSEGEPNALHTIADELTAKLKHGEWNFDPPAPESAEDHTEDFARMLEIPDGF